MLWWKGYRPSTIWEEMNRLSREMSRAFGEAGPMAKVDACVFPPLNIYDDGESFVVRAEVPGIDPDKIDLNSTADTLTIKGERQRDQGAENASYHRRERDYGVFNRTVGLPRPVDPSKVQASYKLGVLEVVLPKAEASKPRRVEVKS